MVYKKFVQTWVLTFSLLNLNKILTKNLQTSDAY